MAFQDRGYLRGGPATAGEWSAVGVIVALNVGIWLANFILTGDLFRELFSLRVSLNDLFALDASLPHHPLRFWQLLTYGFLHDGPSLVQPGPYSPLHLVFNMITLWFFGREVEAVLGRSEFFRFYCAAVVFAGLTWVVGEGFGGVGGRLVGASGGVMAVLAVYIWYFPERTVLLWGVLPVPVWALGILYLVSDLQGAAEGTGKVAHFAHLGGAIFGLLYAWRGWSMGDALNLPSKLFSGRRGMRLFRPEEPPPGGRDADRDDRSNASLDAEVDRILERISRVGAGGLTPDERETLARASKRLKERSRP